MGRLPGPLAAVSPTEAVLPSPFPHDASVLGHGR
jgi:hypothetical protein